MEKRLYRSRSDRMIWGVCSGLAKYFDIDPTIIRIIAVLLLLANGIGIIAYIILAIVVPLESSGVTKPRDVIKENVEEMKETASQLGHEIRSTFTREGGTPEEGVRTRRRSLNMLGITLIVVGILFLLSSFNFLWWLRWAYIWPIVLVAIGLLLIAGARRK